MTIRELVERVQQYDPSADGAWLTRVYEVADAAHEGQRRASGESYIEHPLAVAGVLAELEMDRETIAAALLHDVVEDTSVTSEQVAAEFGDEIAQLVDGVTKLTRIPYQSKEDAQVENLRKMFMAMAKDIRVIIIKLADRLHNMRTLSSLPPAKQQAIARETLDIYAPIAHRLGIWKIKWEIEDDCLRYLDPEPYREIVELVAKTRREREADVREAIARLRDDFKAMNIEAEIHGRPKHFYSIYAKIKVGARFFDDLRSDRHSHHRRHRQRLLRRPRSGPRAVDAAARPIQRLHRDAQAEHVPVAAHDGRRPDRRAARNPDPHLGHASYQRVRHRGALAL